MRLGPEVRSQSQTWLRVPKLESHPEVPRDSVGGPAGGLGFFLLSPGILQAVRAQNLSLNALFRGRCICTRDG